MIFYGSQSAGDIISVALLQGEQQKQQNATKVDKHGCAFNFPSLIPLL